MKFSPKLYFPHLTAKQLLPPKELLLQTKLPLSTIYSLTNYTIENYDNRNNLDFKKKVLEITKSKVGSLTTVGKILTKHTLEGQRIGYELLKIAMENGDLDAGFSMVTMLAKGLPGVRKDEKKILELLNTLSLKNHGPSKYVLALKYLDNNIMDNKNIKTFSEDEKVKIEKGIALLEEAAALGYAQACAQLGHMYQKGIFVEENVNKAFHYLTLAAKDEDFSEAQFLLGNCYNYGAGAKKDLLKAHELYLKAATRGLSVAQHNVALSFEKGIKNPSFQEGGPEYLIEKEMWKAVEYYTLAAEQGFQLSCLNLGKHYLYGLKDGSIKQDVKLARKFFERCLAVDSEFKVQAELYLEDVKEVEKSQENSKFSREIKSGERFCVII